MNVKGNMGLVVVIVVLALALLAVVITNSAGHECEKNSECAENSYCGADNECHLYPEEVVVTQNNYLPAAIVLGLALIFAAYIMRGGRIPLLHPKL